uniref:Evasin P1100 n=1 Tax=Ixodes ricinus TaxID=34613 RepID=E1100_IXORI|nr:RecName: Full=Evasin P1100; Flags: Precursor [Ixodes ricinus]
MAFNVITFLQFSVFVVILFNINLHSASAGSKGSSASQSSDNSVVAKFCDTNCTINEGGKWTECKGGCFCVHVGNETVGRCMKLDGDYDYPSPKPEE